MARVTAHDRLVLASRDRVGSQEKWPRDLDGMLGLLLIKPLPLGIGKQSQELIDLLLIRTHQERAGLDANELQADGRDERLSPIRRRRKRPDISLRLDLRPGNALGLVCKQVRKGKRCQLQHSQWVR